MSKFLHNNLGEVERLENEKFNKTWIYKKGLKFYQTIDVSNLSVSDHEKYDASAFQVVWLKNIDRLMDLIKKPQFGTLPNIHFKDIFLIDVGCGTGISTLYFADNYKFKKYIGFDFDSELIKKAELNCSLFKMKNEVITFFQKDARNYTIPNERCILFMFNPFGLETMQIFIENNINILRNTQSFIAYANDINVDYLDSLKTNIKRIDKYNLSLVAF